MTDKKLTTICFMSTAEQKDLLERWAAEDERSVSYVLRQIIKREVQRRTQAQVKQSVNQQAQ